MKDKNEKYKQECAELIVQAVQYYLESAQKFLSYDEMMKLKIDLEDACREFGIDDYQTYYVL